MIKHDFDLVNYDTDSITICNKDGSAFSEQHKIELIQELNSLFDDNIVWEDDGYYETIVVVRAKNYILLHNGSIKVKGSGLKGSTRPQRIKNFMSEVIETIVQIENKQEMHEQLKFIYNKYVQEIMDIQDIKPWSARKTISSTMMESQRTNETKVIDAIKGSNYVEGDRCFVYYRNDDSLCLAENFDGQYNRTRLLKNLYDTISIFDTVLPVKELFINYSLKKNYKLLEQK